MGNQYDNRKIFIMKRVSWRYLENCICLNRFSLRSLKLGSFPDTVLQWIASKFSPNCSSKLQCGRYKLAANKLPLFLWWILFGMWTVYKMWVIIEHTPSHTKPDSQTHLPSCPQLVGTEEQPPSWTGCQVLWYLLLTASSSHSLASIPQASACACSCAKQTCKMYKYIRKKISSTFRQDLYNSNQHFPWSD